MTSPSRPSGINRRRFLQVASTSAAALSSNPVFGREILGANGRLSLGLIGVGGRGSDLLGQISALAERQNVRILGICDVWQKNLHAAAARVTGRLGNEPRLFTRFGDLLALDGLDAVVIATPDFSHAPILLAALKAHKDVYVEKPMSIDLSLANQALDLARLNKCIVQVGTQYRSDGKYQGAARWLATGGLGTISRLSVAVDFNEARWARDFADCQEAEVDWEAFLLHLAKRPFDPRLIRRWQLYRDCTNGLSGLWMSHYADLTHMLTGAQYPRTGVALGGIYVWKDGREHTDTFHALLEYPEGFLFDWSMGLGNSAGGHFTLHGTKGTMDLLAWTVSNAGSTEKPVHSSSLPAEPGQSHMQNWLECLRSRQKPNADIQFGHQHVVATAMAATALQTGQRQSYDPAQRLIQPG